MGEALRTGTVRAPNANHNADRSAFRTGNNPAHNPGRNRVSHRAANPARRSTSPGTSKRTHSRVRRCRPARPAMPNQNQHVRNPVVQTSAPAHRARRFHPPTRARSLVEDGGGDAEILNAYFPFAPSKLISHSLH
jgi:hypothetical protein